MNQQKEALFVLFQECISLLGALSLCLREERSHLIRFQLDKLIATNKRKEKILRELLRRHKLLQARRTEIDELKKEGGDEWNLLQDTWQTTWDETRVLSETNQRFLEHSVSNIGTLLEHLQRLFGETSTYTMSGKLENLKIQGRVLEGKY